MPKVNQVIAFTKKQFHERESALPGDGRRDRLGPIRIDVPNYDKCPSAGQLFAHGLTNARGPNGINRNLILKRIHVRSAA